MVSIFGCYFYALEVEGKASKRSKLLFSDDESGTSRDSVITF